MTAHAGRAGKNSAKKLRQKPPGAGIGAVTPSKAADLNRARPRYAKL